MREKSKEENVNYDYYEIETKNVELENSVAKLLSEKERICKEINHVKQVFRDQFDSIKKTRVLTKEQRKEIVDIAAQIPSANTIVPGMFKLDLEPLAPRLLQNREAHIDYLKYTQEQADIFGEYCANLLRKSMFDGVHDMCLLDFVENVNSRAKSAKKNKKLNIWKPTGHVFTEVGLKWKPTSRTFNIVGNSCPLTRITSANVVPPKKTTSDSVETQKPELKVYNRKPKNVKNVGSSKKYKIVESKNAIHSEPNHTWGSNATDIPSSFSLVMIVRFGNDNITRIMGYGDYQLGNVTISRVYYVEGLEHNLFSVGQFCDADLEVAFRKNTCFIRNLDRMRMHYVFFGNAEVYLVIVDDYSRFTWVRFLRTKDEALEAIIICMKNIQVCLNATVCNVRTGNGIEFVNQTLRELYKNISISHQTSIARTPQQNGVVERRNQTLVEAARTMLIFSKAPLFLWAEAINTACYTQKRSLIRRRYNKTPYELMQDKKSDLSFFYVFSALYYPTNDNDDLGKLDAKADIGIFAGCVHAKKAFRIYNKRTQKIIETIYVTFNELTTMASEQFSLGPRLHSMTPATSSSGFVPNTVSQQPEMIEITCFNLCSMNTLLLHQLLFLQFKNLLLRAVGGGCDVDLADSLVSTSIDQDAPPSSTPSTQEQEQEQPPNISQGLKCSTRNCGSKPTGNKKNDRISRTPSRNMKNKVEAQPGKKSMFDGVHDMCLLDFVENVNSRAKSAKKHKKQNIWKPTGHVFTEVGLKWKLTYKTFIIVGNSCPLTRITSANVVPSKKTTYHSVETQKPELKVYSRKPKNVKNVGSSKKAKIVESKNANHSEPNHTRGSNATYIPSSSSLVMTCCPDCSLLDSGTTILQGLWGMVTISWEMLLSQEIMSSITAQQTKIDLEFVPKEKRLEIGKFNERLNPGKIQREPTFQFVLDALSLTPCYSAFLITADVPEVYMHQFWDLVYKHDTFYKFKMDKRKRFKLTLEIFRDIFKICPRVHGQDFNALPTDEEIVSFLRDLGHTGEIHSLNDVVVDHMHQPWRTFAALINRSLSGKTSGLNKLRLSRA
ncbi:retrovirus-related pol polyprotein from transposon TNT 1-94 [Tanacetum coccineum]